MTVNIEESIPEKKRISAFRKKIIKWFDKSGRLFPWRKTSDPYKILIAEMMLQRTKAVQVVGVYKEFFRNFRSPLDASKCDRGKIERMLQPLGLKWRAKNFWRASQVLVKTFGGKIPATREDLKTLPGVGDYVSGMVLSTAFHKREWAVDSNVVRIFKRYFGISTSNEGRRDRHVIKMAKVYCFCTNPRNANIALIDFTGTVCIPRKPLCATCPLRRTCKYYMNLKDKEYSSKTEGLKSTGEKRRKRGQQTQILNL